MIIYFTWYYALHNYTSNKKRKEIIWMIIQKKKQSRDETINPYTNSKLVSLLQAFIYLIPEI